MQDTNKDQIARRAAQLIVEDATLTISQAIQAAQTQHGTPESPLPSRRQVRQHCRALAQSVLGEEGYRDVIKAQLSVITQLLDSLRYLQPDARVMVMGRAARGLLDGPGRVYLRLFSDIALSVFADRLVELGYEEPSFHTVDTLHGRMSQLHLSEGGLDFSLTLIRSGVRVDDQLDLFTGKPITTIDAAGLHLLITDSQ